MNDRNKTGLTHRVTAVAAAYLDGLGCKPVETEVPVQAGWVADVASYWYPTQTEAKKLQLTKRAEEILGDAISSRDSILRVYGPGPFTVLVEVKTSRGDFQKDDRKWLQFPSPAHVCFVAFPAGMIEPSEIPKGWYGLQMTLDGTSLRKVHRAGCVNPQHAGMVTDFIAEVGIRRDHRTRYRALRDWAKTYRVQDREKTTRYSAAHLLDGLASWLQGKGFYAERPLAEVLASIGVKRCPQYADQAVEYFESLKSPNEPKDSDAT